MFDFRNKNIIVKEESGSSPGSENNSENVQYKENVVNFWKSGKKKITTVKARYNEMNDEVMKNFQQLYKWKQRMINGGSRIDKLKQIAKHEIGR